MQTQTQKCTNFTAAEAASVISDSDSVCQKHIATCVQTSDNMPHTSAKQI